MKTTWAPEPTPFDRMKQQLEAAVHGAMAVTEAKVAGHDRVLARHSEQLDFALGRTHQLNTSFMAMLSVMVRRGTITLEELSIAAKGYDDAVILDHVLKGLARVLAKGEKGAVGAAEAAPT